MIALPVCDRKDDLARINAPLESGVPPSGREFLESERRKIVQGVKGEQGTAYELDRVFGASEKCCVLHGLRLSIDGFVAQIDHTILTRIGIVYICETKHFRNELKCDTRGEWTTYYNKRPVAIASPLLQVDRHVDMLTKLLRRDHDWMPMLMGKPRRFKVHGVSLVSNTTHVSWPKNTKIDGQDRVMKVEAFDRKRNDSVGMGTLLKGLLFDPVPKDALLRMGEGLAALHEPITFDWAERLRAHLGTNTPPSKSHACNGCGGAVSPAEAFFCRKNPQRVQGRSLCRGCQASQG